MSNLHTGLIDPIKQPGFGRGNNFRAFTAAEKIEGNQRTFSMHSRHYNPATDTATLRPGSMDAFACPTRMGDVLHYRSGEVEFDPIPANPKPAYATY
jgi:hypothetical protein